MTLLIRHGHVLNPADGTDAVADVLVEQGVVKEIAAEIDVAADRIVDAEGCYVMPGFIDMHVHLSTLEYI